MQQSMYGATLVRPPCEKCGQQLWLARIEPADKPDHDLRTFECTNCKTSEIVKVKFK